MDMARLLPLIIILLLLLNSLSCRSDDQLTQAKPLSPGDKLISENGVFALGFFSPTNSNESLYIAICYHGIPEQPQSGSPTATTLPQAQPLHQRSSQSPRTKAWCCRTPEGGVLSGQQQRTPPPALEWLSRCYSTPGTSSSDRRTAPSSYGRASITRPPSSFQP